MDTQAAVDLFNAVEVVLWITLAIIVWRRSAPRTRTTYLWSISLILFGLSDVVEIQTGAFWKPWWLFVWKASCVATFCGLLVWQRRHRNIAKHDQSGPGTVASQG